MELIEIILDYRVLRVNRISIKKAFASWFQ
jgi:hypothetical protein